ncbi:MAG: S41 family peptidase [Gemmatimonadota bacterium]
MKLPRSILAPGAVLLVAVLTGGWFLQQGVRQEDNVFVQLRLLEEVVDHVADQYVDEVERDELFQSAIDGVINGLEDPNTSFLEASAYDNLRIRTEGEYGGVGLEVVERDDWVTVVRALPGGPATRAGIRAGDRIVRVEDRSTEGWSVDEVVDLLRGEAGSEVRLRVRRPGIEDPISFDVTRERIQIRSVPFTTVLNDGIGYVPLQVMSESSTQEVRAAVDSMAAAGARALVLDLRNNPGGLLDQGVAVSDLFLPAGADVVETRGRAAGQDQTFSADDPEAYEGLPVVILVDGQSASASEIVAGALQDHDRALLVGTPSFGKGSVQTLYRLTGGNVLKLTTARWYTPVGRSIEKDRSGSLEDDLMSGALTLDGSFIPRPDTAGRPTYRTDAGRTVYGGGGITPDVILLPDTLGRTEQSAVRALFETGGIFFTQTFDFAVDYIQERPDLERDFSLGQEELDTFYDRLREAGAEVEREDYADASRFVRYELEREIANQKWGRPGEFRHVMEFDRQLQHALQLLEGVTTQEDLFRAGGIVFPEVDPEQASTPADEE